MLRRSIVSVALLSVVGLAACSGGGTAPKVSPSVGSSTPGVTAQSLATTQFLFGKLNTVTSSASTRRPQYVTNAITSVTITLTSVNGSKYVPPSGTAASTTSSITISTCPCTISGPAAPAGSDVFVLTAYDGSGNVVSTASPTLTIAAGQLNNEAITLNGVPASLRVAPPAAAAGTAFSTPQLISVTALDADGGTIMGAYANPITLSDADTSGATTLATSGTDSPAAGQLLSSSDVATLAYTGLAMLPTTIGAAASGTTAASGSFAPTLQPILTNASGTPAALTVGFFGTQSVTLTPSEAGWTNAPYNKTLTVTPAAGCSTVATLSGYTFTLATSATRGNSCTVAVSDGLGGSNSASFTLNAGGSQAFAYTGAAATFTVPTGITVMQIAAVGGSGGSTTGTTGGLAGTMTVASPVSATLTVQVGGAGGNSVAAAAGNQPGGFPDGGAGGSGTTVQGSGGGGSSSVTQGTTLLLDAAGGGGGTRGGNAGYPNGVTGTSSGVGDSQPGAGGTQSAGGAGGTGFGGGPAGANGGASSGGAGGNATGAGGAGGSGGGGGYFGGGGGGGEIAGGGLVAGGGGGASYYNPSGTLISNGIATGRGNGSVTITY